MKLSSFPKGTPKTHFSGFSFHLKRLRFVNVSDKSDMRSSLTQDLMMTSSTYASTFVRALQALLHCSLIGCAGILQPKGHRDVAVGSRRCDERCLESIRFIQAYLM